MQVRAEILSIAARMVWMFPYPDYLRRGRLLNSYGLT